MKKEAVCWKDQENLPGHSKEKEFLKKRNFKGKIKK
jgi:hypothetical protein